MICFNLCNSLPETLFFRDKVSLRVSMIFEEKNPKYKILIFFFIGLEFIGFQNINEKLSNIIY